MSSLKKIPHNERLPVVRQGDDVSGETINEILTSKGYTFKEKIQSGSFGRVVRASKTDMDGKSREMAIKIMNLTPGSHKSRNINNKHFPRELLMLERLRHSCIINIEEIIGPLDWHYYIVMELAAVDLMDIIQVHPIPDPQAKVWFRDMCRALRYLHECGVAHRDVKCENVLIMGNGKAKLTDFGFAAPFWNPKENNIIYSKTIVGTEVYSAPELLQKLTKEYDPIKADCYSAGVVLYVMTNGRFPFPENNKTRSLKLQEADNFTFTTKFKENLTDTLKDLIRSLIRADPRRRLSMNEVLNHEWYKEDIYKKVTDNDK